MPAICGTTENCVAGTTPLDVAVDIREAHSPPGWVYTDGDVYRALLERAFAPSWQIAADAADVRIPGAVHPLTLHEGSLAEPLLLTRDHDDALHCLSNVCTHRGTLVCEHPGNERTLRCRYHGRRFGLDGTFQHMPEFEGVAGFPSPADSLPRVPFEVWRPLVFACASLRPRMSFDALLDPVRRRVAFLPVEQARFDAGRSRDYLVQANWALYCENYLEGFHIPYVHADLNAALDFSAYRTELFEWCSLQVGIARSDDACFELPTGHPDHGQRVAGYYFWLWPNTMLNFYPWGMSVNIVRPLAVDRTRVSFRSYVWDTGKVDGGAGGALDRVEREDEAVVEAVQRGVRARLYGRGRYSPSREQGTHHFHRLLAACVNGSA